MGFVRQNSEELDGFNMVEEAPGVDGMTCPGCGKSLTQLGDIVGTDNPSCGECGTAIVVVENRPRKHRRHHRHHRRTIERRAMAEVLESATAEHEGW